MFCYALDFVQIKQDTCPAPSLYAKPSFLSDIKHLVVPAKCSYPFECNVDIILLYLGVFYLVLLGSTLPHP